MINLTEEQKYLIEKIGLAHEAEGLSPATARILGLLVVSDKTELTFDEIRETLNLSKSATSNALNIAQKLNWAEYITKPGDRKRYFTSRIYKWKDNFMKIYEKKLVWGQLFKEVSEVRCQETEKFNNSIVELSDFMEFMAKEIPSILERWEAQRK